MKVEKQSRGQVLRNMIWKFLESIGVQIIQLIITIILARLLSPEDYGLMAIVLVVITFLGIFVNSGISSYLIYMKDIKKSDFLTALVFNISLSSILVGLLFLFSDHIAKYYSAPVLDSLIKAMAIILPFNAISSIYNAYAMKMSLFKALFVRNMIALPVSGILSLAFAIMGYGVWSLVIFQITYRGLLAIIIVLSIKIKIDGEWRLSRSIVTPMLKYGGFTFLSSFIAFVSDSISDLVIGKKINTEQLGYHNRGYMFPSVFLSIINMVLSDALFPAFSTYNSDIGELKEKCRKVLKLLYYLVFPFLFSLFACAKPLVFTLLTDKWSSAIPIVQIYCLYFLMLPLLQTSSQVYLATGHVKLRSLGEIIKMCFTILLLFCFIGYGIVAVALARFFVNILVLVFTLIVNKYVMGYKFKEFIADIITPLMISLLMFVSMYSLLLFKASDIVVGILQIIVGSIVYLLCLKIMRVSEIEEIKYLIKSKISHSLPSNN